MYEEELWEFVAKVGQKHFTNTWGDSMYVRLIPVPGEKTDEITECVETFIYLIKEKAPRFIPRMERVLELFQENKEKLEQVYFALPTSVFQADTWDDNLLLDEEGHFRGVLDYNLSGKDTVLNLLFEAYGGRGRQKPKEGEDILPGYSKAARDADYAGLMEALRVYRKYYDFTEAEAEAAILLKRYTETLDYGAIHAIEKYAENEDMMNQLFDAIEDELTKDVIDFRSAMLK